MRTRRRSIGVAIPAAVLLVAAAVGVVAGSATTAAKRPAQVTLAGAGLSVEAPRGWLRVAAADAPPELGRPALVAHPLGRSRARALVVTRAAAPLLARLADAKPEAVRLGASDAWRYRGVPLTDGRVADVYVLADSRGTIVAACLGPSGASASLRAGCSAALTTLRLHAGRAVPLGGDAAARRALSGIVAELDQARTSERGASRPRRRTASPPRTRVRPVARGTSGRLARRATCRAS
jgi:hypothetical protein